MAQIRSGSWGTHLFFFSVHCHPRESRKSRNVDERGWGWGWGRWDSYTFFPTQHFLLNFPDTGHAGTHRTPQTFLTRNKRSTTSENMFVSSLKLLSQDDLSKIIQGSPSKSCALDPMPTWLVKQHLLVLLPVLTRIVNTSLKSGVFPSELGCADVCHQEAVT